MCGCWLCQVICLEFLYEISHIYSHGGINSELLVDLLQIARVVTSIGQWTTSIRRGAGDVWLARPQVDIAMAGVTNG